MRSGSPGPVLRRCSSRSMGFSSGKAGPGWIIRDSRTKAFKYPDRERFKFMAANPYVKFIKSQTGPAFNHRYNQILCHWEKRRSKSYNDMNLQKKQAVKLKF